MPTTTHEILSDATALPTDERIRLVEALLESLRSDDAPMLAAWVAEGEDRLDAYFAGTVEAIDADDVLRRHRKT